MRYNVTLLKADILDELNNLKKLDAEFVAIKNLLNHRKEDIDFFDKAATGYFLHNFYNGCENIFGMIARFFENDLGPQSWHRDLLKRMKLDIPGYRPRLIDDETFDTLNGGQGDIKGTGAFLKAVINDIMKEELAKMAEAGLEPKEVNGMISKVARTWFMEQLDSEM